MVILFHDYYSSDRLDVLDDYVISTFSEKRIRTDEFST